jgi:hypothetical protein
MRSSSLVLAAVVATLGFVGAWADVRWCALFVAVFAVVAGACLVGGQRAAPPVAAVRTTLALAVAFAATWLGVAWNTERADVSQPQRWEAWRTEHGASREHYDTFVVSGFPVQRVEGHGGGGAREHLPASKGLWALLLNFAAWTLASAVAAWRLPARALVPAAWVAVLLAPVAGLAGVHQLMVMLD